MNTQKDKDMKLLTNELHNILGEELVETMILTGRYHVLIELLKRAYKSGEVNGVSNMSHLIGQHGL